jgi:hypothetical protein
MNTRGQLGGAIVSFFMIGLAIAIIATMAPSTNPLFEQASTNADLSGGEKVFFEHFNIILIGVATLALFGGAAYFFGGNE